MPSGKGNAAVKYFVKIGAINLRIFIIPTGKLRLPHPALASQTLQQEREHLVLPPPQKCAENIMASLWRRQL
jgi:hypothetical protein